MSSSPLPVLSNRQWLYARRPTGAVGPEHYDLVTTPLDPNELGGTEVIFKVQFWSCDPYMRIQQSSLKTWENPHALNTVQGGGTVGRVLYIGKNVTNVAVGDYVSGYVGWQEYARVSATTLSKLDPPTATIPVSTALGVLGMPGRTAWFGLTDIGRPKPGETLVVSGAAGAVGLIVAQIGLAAGCTVIGVAGSDAKCEALVKEYKLHAALNYKTHDTPEKMAAALAKHSKSIDIYFDNTGGHTSDAIFTMLAVRARIIICGQISSYNEGLESKVELGPRFLHQLIYERASIEGVLARDYIHRIDEQLKALRPMIEAGTLKLPETTFVGFEKLPAALHALFEGANTGKMIVKATDA